MKRFLAAVLVAVLPLAAAAQDAAPSPAPSRAPAPLPPLAAARDTATRHTLALDGRDLAYTARATRINLRDREDEPTASIFSVAYTLDGAAPATRPVAFVWNGGPGASSMYLHLGAFGPKRVALDDTRAVRPPVGLVDNDGTLLAAADLVFVDAPGTGFSRITGKGKPADFYGIDGDAHAFAQFIQRWLTANDRWASPKLLIGESYGTTRAAAVSKVLQDESVALNGIVLISSALDFGALSSSGPGEDLPYVGYLPTMAAVAWYHDALPAPKPAGLDAFLDEVRRFASGAYATALLRGDALDAASKRDLAATLSRYTGLGAAYWERSNLRVAPSRFEKELLRGRDRVVGRLDGRFTGADLDPNAAAPSYDPTDVTVTTAFTAAFNRYVRDDLGYRTETPYLGTNYGEVITRWDYRTSRGGSNVAENLRGAMVLNPSLRVLQASGIYDLATPFYGTELTLGHLGIGGGRVATILYRSGHMIYLNADARHALRRDIEGFIRQVTGR